MFVKAINNGLAFTKPLITNRVFYENRKLINDINTIMILNKDGDLLTCAHVADVFLAYDDINEVFPPILNEIKNASKKEISRIEKKYGINNETVIAIHNILIDVASKPGKLKIYKHEYLNLAIIKMENKTEILANNFPIFNTNRVQVGTSVCGLGFTFPEYDAFEYDIKNEKINVTNKIMNFPIFPITGIITRNVGDSKNNISMFEMNTSVLPGQGGGPVLNQDGFVIGMLVGTKRISSKYFDNMNFNLDLGLAINTETIVKFLDKYNVQYNKLEN